MSANMMMTAGTDGSFNAAAWLFWAESLGYEVYLVDEVDDRYTIIIERPEGEVTEESIELLEVLRPNDEAVERNMLALSEHLASQRRYMEAANAETIN